MRLSVKFHRLQINKYVKSQGRCTQPLHLIPAHLAHKITRCSFVWFLAECICVPICWSGNSKCSECLNKILAAILLCECEMCVCVYVCVNKFGWFHFGVGGEARMKAEAGVVVAHVWVSRNRMNENGGFPHQR